MLLVSLMLETTVGPFTAKTSQREMATLQRATYQVCQFAAPPKRYCVEVTASSGKPIMVPMTQTR